MTMKIIISHYHQLPIKSLNSVIALHNPYLICNFWHAKLKYIKKNKQQRKKQNTHKRKVFIFNICNELNKL